MICCKKGVDFMEFAEVVKLLVDNSVTVIIIAYFLVYNWKFTDSIQQTQTMLIATVGELKKTIEKILEK